MKRHGQSAMEELRLKTLCPTMGRRKIAETLARAGLHLGATTVARMLQAPPPALKKKPAARRRRVSARRPHDAWRVDLTVVPIGGGLWAPWLPFTLPQRWPFCWQVAVVMDGCSRRVLGFGAFRKTPNSEQIRALLGRTINSTCAKPKAVVCDRGKQFDCRGFRRWAERRGIEVRYGAVGRHGSIALVERLIRTLKESLRQWAIIPLKRAAFRRELTHLVEWYNAC